MKHLPNWELCLHSFASAELGKLFVWGETNCISLALRALDAQCGTSLHLKGRHFMSSALRAKAFVRSYGLDGLVNRLQAEGLVLIEKNFARTGDIQLVETPETIGASVVLGRQHLSSTEADGVCLYDHRILQSVLTMGVR